MVGVHVIRPYVLMFGVLAAWWFFDAAMATPISDPRLTQVIVGVLLVMHALREAFDD